MGVSDDLLYHQQWYLQPYATTTSSQAHSTHGKGCLLQPGASHSGEEFGLMKLKVKVSAAPGAVP